MTNDRSAPRCRRLVAATILAAAALTLPAHPAAQTVESRTSPRATGPLVPLEASTSADVRREFIELLKTHPPAVGQVFKLDPTLLSNDAYMAAYPGIVTFLQQHPEVRRNALYFLQPVESPYYEYSRDPAAEIWSDMMNGLTVFLVIVSLAAALAWIIRTLVDYRRWNRLAKVQSEAHAKLLDRFTANDELLAYIQSAAGSRFLQSAPIALDPGARQPGAPFSRILWSVQAGLVLAAGGAGLGWVSARGGLDIQVAQPFYTMGVVALALGAGFVLSAVVAFVLSRRLGLFDAAPLGPLADRPDRRDATGA